MMQCCDELMLSVCWLKVCVACGDIVEERDIFNDAFLQIPLESDYAVNFSF